MPKARDRENTIREDNPSMVAHISEDVTFQLPEISAAAPKPFYSVVKRLFDIVVSLAGILSLFIPMIVIGIIIKCDSIGPALFRQERLGLNGKPFYIFKFRTMGVDAEKNGAQWATKDDHRVTRVGRFLRKKRIDEFPQLINILCGQMSLVGPRPERACFYREFETYIDGFSQRLKVVPGLTGWAQVNGGYDLPPEEKIVYDMEYIEKRSFAMDCKCMFMTFRVIVTGSGAR